MCLIRVGADLCRTGAGLSAPAVRAYGNILKSNEYIFILYLYNAKLNIYIHNLFNHMYYIL